MEDVRLLPVKIATRAMHSDLPDSDDDKYWIRITASNAEVDLHHSIMDPKTTLRNFEKEAKTEPGVALKDHHAYRSFGYGRSANAVLTDKNELLIDFFILKNMDYAGSSREFHNAEQLIRAIEHGLVNQGSVGFYGAREVCNLCKLPVRRYSYWNWDAPKEEYCSHKMGKAYDVGNGKMETATYTVYDGHLKEVSLVEFGSNRQTAIEKKREIRSFMEELLMTDQEWIAKLREALDIPAIRSTDEPDEVLKTLEVEVTNLRSQVETQKDEIAGLLADAENGQVYRQSRIDEAIKQGIRAYGEDFDEPYHREYYSDMPMEQLEKHIAHNKKRADEVLSAGRATQDTHEPAVEKDPVSNVRQRLRRRR